MHKHVFTFTPSLETQGRSVGSGEKAGRKFSGTGKRAPGYRLSPNYVQKFKRMLAPDWAQKMLGIVRTTWININPWIIIIIDYNMVIIIR